MYTFSLCSRVWHTEVAMAVIDKGADLNARANDGWTPLHYALMNDQSEVLRKIVVLWYKERLVLTMDGHLFIIH